MPGTGASGGHNSTPTALLKAKGTFRKDRHGERVDLATPVLAQAPPPPDDIAADPLAGFVWTETTGMHVAIGTLSGLDLVALGYACRDIAQLDSESAALAAEGTVIATEGGPKPNPRFMVVDKLRARVDRVLARFGWTPADRARLKAPPPPEAKLSEFD